jgi:acyl-CoA thioesterase II
LDFATMMALEPHGPDTFVGTGPEYPWGGLYGGQIVAQALRAAGHSVEARFLPHSLHAYFIRAGNATEPIRFEVDRDRDGRSFCTRRVVVRQSTGVILNLAASFHIVEDAPFAQAITMPDVESPEALASPGWSALFERRFVTTSGSPTGRATAWLRLRDPVADDPILQACGLAYVSDDLPTDAVFAVHPDMPTGFPDEVVNPHEILTSASLDHAIWFHGLADPSKWQLHDFTSHGVGGSRGLASGQVYTESGRHIATISQEVLLRRRRHERAPSPRG